MENKICHVTTAHLPEDIRIYQKECVSIGEAGYDIYLIQSGDSYEKDGVHIIGLGPLVLNKLKRTLFTVNKAYKISKEIDAKIYHLHDPELLRIAVKLKKQGKQVVFDSHEDYPAQIEQKKWIPSFLRKPISRVYSIYEKKVLSSLDGVVGVTPHQVERLKGMNDNVIMVSNFPKAIKEDLNPTYSNMRIAFPGMVYDGWCIKEILDAIEDIPDVIFSIRSTFDVSEEYMSILRQHPAWRKVDFQGRKPHSEILNLLVDSMCGLAITKYGPNVNGKKGTLGNTKLFEYMQVGIPVICTDLDLWKEIVNAYGCGYCVKPDDIEGIRNAIQYIMEHPDKAKEMGRCGQRAVAERFCWEKEAEKLIGLYENLLGQSKMA